MKNIALISTGGTIAGSGRMSEYEAGTLDVRSIIDSIPEIKSLANLKLFPLCSKDSNDITEKDWLALRDLCHQLEKDPSIDGIVITHGTDTFEETAFFLNLTLQNRKPVVMTGAMRPASAVSADGPMNLYEAVSLASHPNAYKAGVLAVFADTIYSARDLVKTNSLKTNAFDMGEYGALGFMRDEHVYFENMPYRKHTCESLFAHLEYSQLPRVGIFYVHAGADPQLLRYMLDHYDVIVLAGSGAGNYSNAIKTVVEEYDGPCRIVRSSRLLEGAVFESKIFDPEQKTIPSFKLSPHKARILLMVALVYTQDLEKLKMIFETY